MADPYAYAEIGDLTQRFRTLTGEEAARAEVMLEDASFWLGVWAPGLDAAIAGGNEQAATAAKLLVVAMVRRALQAPIVDDGVQSQSLQAGQFQQNIVYRNPDGNLYLYGKELDALLGLLRADSADAVSMTSRGL